MRCKSYISSTKTKSDDIKLAPPHLPITITTPTALGPDGFAAARKKAKNDLKKYITFLDDVGQKKFKKDSTCTLYSLLMTVKVLLPELQTVISLKTVTDAQLLEFSDDLITLEQRVLNSFVELNYQNDVGGCTSDNSDFP